MMRLNSFALLATVMALFVTNAYAQSGPDYVFTVPVRIENASPLSGHQGTVVCSVQNMSGGRVIRGGHGSTVFDIGPSGYHAPVRVEVRLMDGVSRASGVRWACELQLSQVTNRAGETVAWGSPNVGTALPLYPVVTGQTVSSTNLVVQAEFSH